MQQRGHTTVQHLQQALTTVTIFGPHSGLYSSMDVLCSSGHPQAVRKSTAPLVEASSGSGCSLPAYRAAAGQGTYEHNHMSLLQLPVIQTVRACLLVVLP